MLILSRKVGERVVIANSIVVTVLPGGGKRIRLGLETPPGVPILRAELCPRDPDRLRRADGEAGR